MQLGQPKLEFFLFQLCLCLLFLPTCFLFFCQIALDKSPLRRIIRKRLSRRCLVWMLASFQQIKWVCFRPLCKSQSQHKHWSLIILHFWIQAQVSYGRRAFLADRSFVERILRSNIKKYTREKDKKRKAFNFYVVAFYCDQGWTLLFTVVEKENIFLTTAEERPWQGFPARHLPCHQCFLGEEFEVVFHLSGYSCFHRISQMEFLPLFILALIFGWSPAGWQCLLRVLGLWTNIPEFLTS